MKIKREPEMRFWMALYGKNVDLAGIEELLHVKLDNNRIDVPNDLPDALDGPLFYEYNVIQQMEKIIKERFKGKYPVRKSIQTEFAHVGGKEGLQFQVDAVAYCG